jgi:hypothetical protein
MRQNFLFLAVFLLFSCRSFCQTTLFENYYKTVQSLTSGMKTYKVLVVRDDTSFAPRYSDQRNHLKIAFPFLHKMSEVKKDPDLFIKIIIKDTNVKVDYTLLSSDANKDEYQIRWNYDLKFLIQFDAGNKGSKTVPVCDFTHYSKYPPGFGSGHLTLKNNSYGATSDSGALKWQDINYYVSINEEYLERKSDFKEDFVSALKIFSRDQCK